MQPRLNNCNSGKGLDGRSAETKKTATSGKNGGPGRKAQKDKD